MDPVLYLVSLVILGTSIWVAGDASNLKVRPQPGTTGLFNLGPGGWFVACLGLWIVAFPCYLSKRTDYVQLKLNPAASVNHAIEKSNSIASTLIGVGIIFAMLAIGAFMMFSPR
jgi:hypothetical protein